MESGRSSDRITIRRGFAIRAVVGVMALVGAGSAQAQVSFDRAFGIGVETAAAFENCTTASGCQAGTPSGAAGGMSFPQGVAVDAQGRILVAEFLNSPVSRFTGAYAVPALSTWALAVLTLTLLGLGARRVSRSRATPAP